MRNLKDILESVFDVDNNINKIDKDIKSQIKQFLKDNFKGYSNCKISTKPNSDGKYEVSCSKDIYVTNKKLTSLTNGTFVWTIIGNNFYCTDCNLLTSLEGAPKEVGNIFNCGDCDSLTSLEGAPEKTGHFICNGCGAKFTKEDVKKISDVRWSICV